MTALITGASGLLGHALAHQLANSGQQVRVLLRRPASQSRLFEGTAIECVQGTLEDVTSLRSAAKGAEVIYHCAAASTDWADWNRFYSSNVVGVRNCLSAAMCEPRLQRFLHVSSTDVYGYPKQVCNEDTPMVETDLPYNRTKIAGERLVQAAADAGLPVTIIRPASIYGPRDAHFVLEVYDQLRKDNMPLIAKGQSSPGLLYVANAVDALVVAAASPKTIGKTYNLRDETAETWEQYLNAFADAAGLRRTRLNLPFWFAWSMACTLELFHRCLNRSTKPLLTRHTVYLMTRDAAFPIERAKRDFGFKSRIDFHAAVEKSVKWAQSKRPSCGDLPVRRRPTTSLG